jgi:hypothetical protein
VTASSIRDAIAIPRSSSNPIAADALVCAANAANSPTVTNRRRVTNGLSRRFLCSNSLLKTDPFREADAGAVTSGSRLLGLKIDIPPRVASERQH